MKIKVLILCLSLIAGLYSYLPERVSPTVDHIAKSIKSSTINSVSKIKNNFSKPFTSLKNNKPTKNKFSKAKQLLQSISSGKTAALENYLNKGGNPSAVYGKSKMSLLGRAAFHGSAKSVALLLKAGADVHYADLKGNTAALLSLMQDRDPNLYKVFLAFDVDVDHQNNNNQSLLTMSVDTHNYTALNEILSLDSSSEENISIAFLASLDNQDQNQIDLFMTKFPGITSVATQDGTHPIFAACKDGMVDSMSYLLKHQPELLDNKDDLAKLMEFARAQDTSCYEYLSQR